MGEDVMRGEGAAIAVVVVMLATGCGQNGPEPGSSTQVSETVEDVDYYYACGNEVLELADGRRFSPFVDQDQVDDAADARLPASDAISTMVVATTLAVPEPQPGDDTGTLTIYEDGTARFLSETGTEAWLTEEEQTYDWVC